MVSIILKILSEVLTVSITQRIHFEEQMAFIIPKVRSAELMGNIISEDPLGALMECTIWKDHFVVPMEGITLKGLSLAFMDNMWNRRVSREKKRELKGMLHLKTLKKRAL